MSFARKDWFLNSPVAFLLGLTFLAIAVAFMKLSGQNDSYRHHRRRDVPERLHLGSIIASIGFFVSGSFLILLSVWPTLRLRLRTGRWPVARPTTLERIRELVTGQSPPIVMAEGWSFFIGRRTAGAHAFALRSNWSGVVSSRSESMRVRSGMTFGELVQEAKKLGRALVDRPQFDQLSVGGAVRTCGHGWFGQSWFIDSVVALQGIERGSGKVVEAKRGDEAFWQIAFAEDFVITEVEVVNVENRTVHIRQRVQNLKKMTSEQWNLLAVDHEPEWQNAPFRLIFVSARQVIRKWATYTNGSSSEVEISDCKYRCRTLLRHLKIPAEIDEVDSVADAHTLIQTIWPIESVIERIAGNVNVEIFVAKSFDWDAVAPAIAGFHRKHGGRTELRERSFGGAAISALDVIVPVGQVCLPCCASDSSLREWFIFLNAELEVIEGCLHSGKYLPDATDPVRILAAAEFWPSVSIR
eukprot:TRINITY_DN16801_c0_g2_i1.p1 TRINITY_DN16801_c0_g2~~TRINITY_DN16801_c0_g2_i1.p1  ORF type:complete len:469 (+),score=56.37 TRINITY_DN16801_c0_g2_i1:56-1462(+)